MSKSLLEQVKYSPLSRIATLPIRIRGGFSPLWSQAGRTLKWLVSSREWVNYSYDYDPVGLLAVAAAIGDICGVPAETVRGYAKELSTDAVFAERYRQRVSSTRLRYISDPKLHMGKCLFNYMLVRASGARVVFEAGTERGLSALAICRALRLNAAGGGAAPKLITVDIATDRGEFLQGDEDGLVTRLTGDSVAAIRDVGLMIDCFIHDTVNDSQHTQLQLATVASKLAPRAVIHTSWFNQDFVAFCERAGMRYLEVAERPQDHWYAGRRCGLASLR
ncbi:MAG: class I SAM-dependent methyltransferase [Rubrivivax sp.]|nr:MAG: class I SAM-dependent methyltransferase [Rubrivivax sp.]